MEPPMTYDDHFEFSFDDRVLASNSKGLVNYLEDAPELMMGEASLANRTFDGSKILSQSWIDSSSRKQRSSV